MVAVDACLLPQVQVQGPVGCDSPEKLHHQFCIKYSHLSGGELQAILQVAAPRKVQGHPCQCFIQRAQGMAKAAETPFIAYGLGQSLAENDPGVFHQVMIIYLLVPGGLHG